MNFIVMSKENQEKFDRACSLVIVESCGLPGDIELPETTSLTGGAKVYVKHSNNWEPKEESGISSMAANGDITFQTVPEMEKPREHEFIMKPINGLSTQKLPKLQAKLIERHVRLLLLKKQIFNQICQSA